MVNGRVWQFDCQTKEKQEFIKKIRSQVIDPGVITDLLSRGFYRVTLYFNFEYPKSKKRKTTPNIEEIPHTTKPDLDNLVKFVLDCGNELLWPDDKAVIYLHAVKSYSEYPKTIIVIG